MIFFRFARATYLTCYNYFVLTFFFRDSVRWLLMGRFSAKYKGSFVAIFVN
jgi:hypothetical protein